MRKPPQIKFVRTDVLCSTSATPISQPISEIWHGAVWQRYGWTVERVVLHCCTLLKTLPCSEYHYRQYNYNFSACANKKILNSNSVFQSNLVKSNVTRYLIISHSHGVCLLSFYSLSFFEGSGVCLLDQTRCHKPFGFGNWHLLRDETCPIVSRILLGHVAHLQSSTSSDPEQQFHQAVKPSLCTGRCSSFARVGRRQLDEPSHLPFLGSHSGSDPSSPAHSRAPPPSISQPPPLPVMSPVDGEHIRNTDLLANFRNLAWCCVAEIF